MMRSFLLPAVAGALLLTAACGGGGPSATGGDGGAGTGAQAGCIDPMKSLCGGVCVDTHTSKDHCGGCDKKLGPGMECIAGAPACTGGGELYCDGKCVDASTDAKNCGACGRVCPGPDAFCVEAGMSCLLLLRGVPNTPCDQQCGALGYQCTFALATYYNDSQGTSMDYDLTCAEQAPPNMTAQWVYDSSSCDCSLTF